MKSNIYEQSELNQGTKKKMSPSNFRLKNGAKYIFYVKNTKYIATKYYHLHEHIHILIEYRPSLGTPWMLP